MHYAGLQDYMILQQKFNLVQEILVHFISYTKLDDQPKVDDWNHPKLDDSLPHPKVDDWCSFLFEIGRDK